MSYGLWNAISNNDLKGVQELLSTGEIDLNKPYELTYGRNSVRSTYLLQACIKSSPVVAFALVKAGAKVDTRCRIPYRDHYYDATALILAVLQRKVNLVKKLLHRCDADVNATNSEGLGPLHFIIDLSGESPLKKYKEPFKYSATESAEVREEIAQLLLTAGATVDLQDNYYRRTPLYLAALVKDVSTAKLLLSAGASVDLQDNSGLTPLYLAASENDVATAEILRQHHARVDVPDREGKTPLHLSARALRAEMLKVLLHGTDVDSSTVVNLAANDGTTPLYAAIEAMVAKYFSDQDTTVVKFLIDKGADLEAKKHHLTPLHLAAEGGLLNTVKVLVEAGADINAETPNTCLTPLDMAEHRNREDVVDYLAARQESDARGGEKMKREEPSVEEEEGEEQPQKSDAPVEEVLEGAVVGFEQVLVIKDEGNEGQE